MARNKPDTEDAGDKVVKLVPSIRVETNVHPDLLHPAVPSMVNGKYQYHLVEVNGAGDEIPGSDFFVGETNYKMTYAGNNSFKLKKNIQ